MQLALHNWGRIVEEVKRLYCATTSFHSEEGSRKMSEALKADRGAAVYLLHARDLLASAGLFLQLGRSLGSAVLPHCTFFFDAAKFQGRSLQACSDSHYNCISAHTSFLYRQRIPIPNVKMPATPAKRQKREEYRSAHRADEASTELPKKKFYRQRAHANPFSDHKLV